MSVSSIPATSDPATIAKLNDDAARVQKDLDAIQSDPNKGPSEEFIGKMYQADKDMASLTNDYMQAQHDNKLSDIDGIKFQGELASMRNTIIVDQMYVTPQSTGLPNDGADQFAAQLAALEQQIKDHVQGVNH
jgi:hypothetical protein